MAVGRLLMVEEKGGREKLVMRVRTRLAGAQGKGSGAPASERKKRRSAPATDANTVIADIVKLGSMIQQEEEGQPIVEEEFGETFQSRHQGTR